MNDNSECRKSISIVSLFDAGGVVDDYIIYFLSSLKKVTDRMIVVVNGILTNEGETKLKGIVPEIYFRKNTGFDFGAYKDVIADYLSPNELDHYQELILCNDTCFGPFVPFEDIFWRMDADDLEFWSLNYIDNPLLPHFQSYFMVFRKNAIRLIYDFLFTEVDSEITDIFLAHGYEHSLSEKILTSHLRTDFYTSDACSEHDIDILKSPDYAVKQLGLPVLKKKVFSENICKEENYLEALRVIGESAYPIEYIYTCVKRLYGVELPFNMKKMYFSKKYIFENGYVSRKKVIEFCEKNDIVYIYGNGYMSILFMARFRRYMRSFGGYVVSDEYYQKDLCRGENVYCLSRIDKNIPIVVALMKQSAKQVTEKVKNLKNVLFLSIDLDKA